MAMMVTVLLMERKILILVLTGLEISTVILDRVGKFAELQMVLKTIL